MQGADIGLPCQFAAAEASTGGYGIRPYTVSASSTTRESCGCRKAPRSDASIRPYRLQKSVFPLGRLKAWQNKIVAHQQRALDEHTVRRQQGDLLVLGHGWQLVLQAQIFVD